MPVPREKMSETMLTARIPQALVVRMSWTTICYGLVQLLRLLTNIVLARLLAPSLFGLMLIVNTIKVGVELLSDIGISQNIVSNKDGDNPDFFDTAWTIQALRGIILGALCFLSAGAIATFFEQAELKIILQVAALLFVFSGFHSVGGALLQKRLSVPRLNIIEVAFTALSFVAHVGLALITPTIWALVLGAVISSAGALMLSFLMINGLRQRFIIHRPSARQLLVFGKWIFLSSVVFFLAMNFDRLYFAKRLSLAELGIYGIARTLSDVVSLLAVRYGNMLLFPMIAAMGASAIEVRQRLLRGRRTLLLAAAVGIASFIAVSDEIVMLLYDSRYHGAALVLPLLLIGVWFAVLNSVNESILMGMAKPSWPAIANAVKLVSYVVAVPLAFHFYGFLAAILVISGGEAVKYVTMWLLSRKHHLGFGRDDLALTVVLLVAVVGLRSLLFALGLTGDIEALFPALSWITL